MPIDNVLDRTPRVQYVAATSQTAFDYPFAIFQDADLVVDVNGVTKAPSTDYTVSGAGNDTGGTITFLVAPGNGAIVTIYRDIAIERTADFQTNGPLRSSTFNDELDKLTLILQQLEAQNGRSLRLPITGEATSAQAELSPIANWISKFVTINANGVPEPATIVAGTISQSIIAALLQPQTSVEQGAGVTPVNLQYAVGNVLRYATNGTPGTTNMTAAFTAARAVTGGRYHIPCGTYLVDASPDVWADAFTADGSTFIKISSTTYTVSNAFAGRLRYNAASNVKLDVVDAVTDNVVMYLQNSQPGTATGFYRTLAFQVDGHWTQASPATNGGSVDRLWQRSPLNADPAGNRFNETFEETGDVLKYSFATTASGAPSFDTYMQATAGLSPTLLFPALRPQFNQGISIKQRAAGGFEFAIEQSSSTQAKLKQIGGSATTYLTFRDGAFGFFGSTGTSQQTVTGSRGGNAALANLLTALAATGLIVDGSS